MNRFQQRFAVALSATALLAALGAPARAQFTINGGGSSSFQFNSNMGTSNGLPSGGDGGSAPGAGVVDADLGSQGDAYDNAAVLFVNNTVFVPQGGALTQSGQSANGGTVAIAGLNVSLSYFVSPTLPVLRTFTTLTNPTAGTINVPVTFVNNSGSDGSTIIKQTSSGDLTFDVNDRFLISDDTADNATASGDPALTYVFFGLGGAPLTPTSVSTTVFNAAGTQGTQATFSLALGAGQTASFLFFNALDSTTNAAAANAPRYATLATLGATDLLTGLSTAQLNTVVNYASGSVSVNGPEPGTVALFAVGLVAVAAVRRRRNG
jgi:hypothetical protein